MKKFLTLGIIAVTFLSACEGTKQIDFADPKTGEIIDRHWERKDAMVAFAPATSTLYDWDPVTNQVMATHYVAGATPVQQVAGPLSAGLTGFASVAAAKATKPMSVSVDNSNANSNQALGVGGDGGNANASNFNWTNVRQQLTSVQWTQVETCLAPVQASINGIFNNVWHPGCNGTAGKG